MRRARCAPAASLSALALLSRRLGPLPALRRPAQHSQIARAATQQLSGGTGMPEAADAPVDVDVNQFAYHLPEELIAQHPALPRGSSRLLVPLPRLGSSIPLHQHLRAQAHNILLAARTHGEQPPPSQLHAEHTFADLTFADVARLLPAEAHMIFNVSKVFAARMFATRQPPTDTPAQGDAREAVEVMFLSVEQQEGGGSYSPAGEPMDASAALRRPCHGQQWRCMIRRADVLPGDTFHVQGSAARLQLEVMAVHSIWEEEEEVDGVEATVRFKEVPAQRTSSREAPLDGADMMMLTDAFKCYGTIPLPPYMHREVNEEDKELYQTVFAESEGSVAAPTAGLHFTDELIDKLKVKGLKFSHVNLHVSAGTFRPVTVDNIADHDMHEEQFSVDKRSIRDLIRSLSLGRPLIPVGTTSVRVLESLYWLGTREFFDRQGMRDGTAAKAGHNTYRLGQWDAYKLETICTALTPNEKPGLPCAAEALTALLDANPDRETVSGSTGICIVPGYTFKMCDALVTNFHQPHSTLMLLVAALQGETESATALYTHAVQQKYRFLSYGDACLLHNAQDRMHTQETVHAVEAQHLEGKSELARMFDQFEHAVAPEKLKEGTRVLLHSCCAPCSGAMVEQMLAEGHDVTVLFYNPNIHPKEEYTLRKDENKRYAASLGIPFVDLDYDVDEWYQRAKGMEFSPERGDRCTMCFDMRFERTALYASENNFDVITTTNATSRWKDADQVNASGIRSAQKYDGVKWWFRDWQTDEMTQRKYRINADQRFYKQEYCGCAYSLRDTNEYRKKEGLGPVVIAGDNFYSDPMKDSEEESEQVVEEFFSHVKSPEQEQRRQLREMYRQRHKNAGGTEGNNW